MKPRLSPAPSLFLLSPPLAIVSHVAHESFVIQTAAAYGLLRGRAAQTYSQGARRPEFFSGRSRFRVNLNGVKALRKIRDS